MIRRDRVEARLRALNINQFEAAKRAGKGSHFIYDFFIGKKKSFKGDGPIRLAKALNCSIEYLTGESDVPGSPPGDVPFPSTRIKGGIPYRGVVEAGVFRKAASYRPPDRLIPVAPDPRHPKARQVVYAVRGDALASRGIIEGMFLICIEGAENEVGNGSLVIVEHTRLDGVEIEISARELQHFPDRTEYRANGVEPIVVRGGETDEPGGKARMIAKVVGAVMTL